MDINKVVIMEKLEIDELGYVKYVIEAMKNHGLTFAFIDMPDDPEKIEFDLISMGFTVKREDEIMKIFWNE